MNTEDTAVLGHAAGQVGAVWTGQLILAIGLGGIRHVPGLRPAAVTGGGAVAGLW